MTIRLALLLLAAAAQFDAAGRLGRRLFPDETRLARAVITLLFMLSLLAAVVTAAGAPGLLRTPLPAILIAVVFAIGRVLGRGPARAEPLAPPDGRAGGWGAAWIAIAALAAAPAAGKALQAILHAPWDGDSLDFHLPNIVGWYFTGSLGRDPLVLTTWWYPGLARIPTLTGFLFLGNDLLSNIQNLPFLLLAAGGVALLVRETGGSVGAAAGAAALVGATPILTQLVGSNMDEVGTAAGAAVLAAFLARALRAGRTADYLAAGLGAGILLGSKITGVGFVAATGAAFLACGLRPTARGALAFALGAAALAGYWYVRLLFPVPGGEWVDAAPREHGAGPFATALLASIGDGTILRRALSQMAKDGAAAGILGAPVALVLLVAGGIRRSPAGGEHTVSPRLLPLLTLGALAVFLVTPQTGFRPAHPEGWIPGILGIRYAVPYLVFAAALLARDGERRLRGAFPAAILLALAPALLRVGTEQISPMPLAAIVAACAVACVALERLGRLLRVGAPVRVAIVLCAAALVLTGAPRLQARRDAERERRALELIPGYEAFDRSVPRGATVLTRGWKQGYPATGPDLGRHLRRFGPPHHDVDALLRTLEIARAGYVAISPRGESATAPEAISAEIPPGWPPEDSLCASSPRFVSLSHGGELHLYGVSRPD